MNKSFNFLRWFSLLSLVCILLIGATLAVLLSRFSTQQMIERDAVVSKQFIDSIMQAEDTWSYFVNREDSSAKAVLDSFFNHVVYMSDVVRGSVYAQDGTIIWSSNKNFIGKAIGPNPELQEALEGKIVVKTWVVGEDDKAEHIDFAPENMGMPIIEEYLPVTNTANGEVIGAVEIYKMPEKLFAAIQYGKLLVWGSTVAAGTLLYVVLFGFVRRANTALREQQEKLIDSETMAAIGEMASAVGHGIRNPLSAIRSSAELTMDVASEDVHEFADDIIQESDRLDRWLREFLAFSQAGCAPFHHRQGTANINDLVTEHLRDMSRLIEKSKVHLVVDTLEAAPRVIGNEAALGQVLSVILTNALDVMPNGGELTASSKLDALGLNVLVKIVDTGPGLSKEMLQKIFRPSFTTKKAGLGLGLALSRRILARYGGQLQITSEEGEGTTVTLKIPVAKSFPQGS